MAGTGTGSPAAGLGRGRGSARRAGRAAGAVTQLGKAPCLGKTLLVLVRLKGVSFRASLWQWPIHCWDCVERLLGLKLL